MSEPLKEIGTSKVRLTACVGILLVARVASALAGEASAPSPSSNQIWDDLETSQIGADTRSGFESADTVWDAIATTRIEIDTNTGSWHLADSSPTRSLLGRQVTLYGSVQVQDPSADPTWFIFLRSMSECGACDLGDPTKIVKVIGANLSPKIGDVVTATGRFAIGVDKNVGVVFQLQDAKVALR